MLRIQCGFFYWYQNPRRIYATISVLVFASFIIYQIVQNMVAIATGK